MLLLLPSLVLYPPPKSLPNGTRTTLHSSVYQARRAFPSFKTHPCGSADHCPSFWSLYVYLQHCHIVPDPGDNTVAQPAALKYQLNPGDAGQPLGLPTCHQALPDQLYCHRHTEGQHGRALPCLLCSRHQACPFAGNLLCMGQAQKAGPWQEAGPRTRCRPAASSGAASTASHCLCLKGNQVSMFGLWLA